MLYKDITSLFILFFLLLLIPFSNIYSEEKKLKNFILIHEGYFDMGSDNGNNDEKPIHRVFVESFLISKSEVTIWEYFECVKEGIVPMPNWWNKNYFDENYYRAIDPDWLNFPVAGISWEDAVKFCKWKGQNYRLPTEEEWEYAARAGVETEYLWGNESAGGDFFDTYDSTATKLANFGQGLRSVMSKKPNNWGLYDMTGNVLEWCQNVYDDRKHTRSVRGGSWNEYSFNLRLSNRSYGEQNKGYKGVGFRLVYQEKVE
ncbi:MAG: SUMF1/EgtB/PvdO family nonheme iron enzyme [Candidatus Delongbacteria bacterium]|nr:SUMF1/EgtB/PvdO family nonheme iron enzyme [Candidatus Delongbacteria bacterium]